MGPGAMYGLYGEDEMFEGNRRQMNSLATHAVCVQYYVILMVVAGSFTCAL